MTAPGCPIGVRELARRRQALHTYVGRQIRDLRTEAGITQRALAAAVGIDQGHLSRIERGLIQAGIDVLLTIGACLGADLGIRYFPGSGPRLGDRFQAPVVEALMRLLHPRWLRIPELAVPTARGFVDLALGLRGADLGIECEVHSELRVLDEILRRHAEKTSALADLGTVGGTISRLLVVRSTQHNRNVVRLYEATLRSAYPGLVTEALAALRGGEQPWPGPTLLWVRVSRGHAEILERPPRGVRVGR